MQVSTIGLDLAKNVLQVHGINANENGSSQALPPICSCSGFRRFVKVLMPPRAPWSKVMHSLRFLSRGAPCQDLPAWFSRG